MPRMGSKNAFPKIHVARQRGTAMLGEVGQLVLGIYITHRAFKSGVVNNEHLCLKELFISVNKHVIACTLM